MSIARFWRETPHRYNLDGVRCAVCQTVFFPRRSVCPTCSEHRHSIGRLEPFHLSGDGEVVSYSVVHDAAEGFEMQVPYVFAIVQTREGPMLTGQVVDIEPDGVRIGRKVRATFRKLREEGRAGVIHYGYKFTPVGEGPRPPDPKAPEEPATVPTAAGPGTASA